jgi:hypothetical protein
MCEAREVAHSLQVALLGAYTHPTRNLAGSALMGYANVIITQTCHFCMYVDICYNVWGQETLRSRPTRAYSGLLAPTRNLGLGFK